MDYYDGVLCFVVHLNKYIEVQRYDIDRYIILEVVSSYSIDVFNNYCIRQYS